MHSRKSLLISNGKPYVKKDSNGNFDVSQGAYDSCEVSELCGLFLLSELKELAPPQYTILYRDDGLMALKATGRQLDKVRQKLEHKFSEFNLQLECMIPLTNIVEYLDIKFNLSERSYRPYKKPNDSPLYINACSNHPPPVIKANPRNINNRISLLSCSEAVFNEEKDIYQNALRRSGYTHIMKYDPTVEEKPKPMKKKKRAKRQVCWFNPPWSESVRFPVGKAFLNIVDMCFPKRHPLHKHFNRSTLKMSYSTCKNLKAHVAAHNRNILLPTVQDKPPCNCRNKAECPLAGQCQVSELVYEAKVEEEVSGDVKKYFGQTLRPFKLRYYEHTMAIRNENSPHATALSNHIWKLKNAGKQFKLTWSIKSRAPTYKSGSSNCQLCLHEKTEIALCKPRVLLNSRTELLNKCIHKGRLELEKVNKNCGNPP